MSCGSSALSNSPQAPSISPMGDTPFNGEHQGGQNCRRVLRELRTGNGQGHCTWSCSALGNCRGSLVVSMSKAQIRGSALCSRSSLRSRVTLPLCN